MRNLYNGRTEKPCGRVVFFDDLESLGRFVYLYQDLFYKPVKSCAKWRSNTGFTVRDYDDHCTIYFTAFKDDWKKMVDGAGLKNIHNSERFWRYEAV